MYKLYFESSGQAKVMNFVETKSDSPMPQHIETLVINTDSSNEVFCIGIPAKLISSVGICDDKDVTVSNIELSNSKVIIGLADVKKTVVSKIASQQNEIVSVRQINKDQLVICNIEKGGNVYTKIEIELHYDAFSSLVIVHCVPLCSIYDVVLDFGSEASQMLIKSAEDDSAAVPQRLFHNTLRHYWGASVRGKRVYDQQDDDDKLFRSIFYKKEKGKMQKDFEIDIPQKKDSYFAFISKRTDILGERIPNIKISYLTGKEAEGGEKLRLHTGVILRFLHEALMQIGDIIADRQESNNVPIAIRFTLLLPNVMPQNSVSSLLRRIREFSNSDDFLNYHKDIINIELIDVESCSESDASFLERMNKIGMTPGNRCLTIDIGKGTTDFSITQKQDAYNASSEFRSGFVGAGNALSYAIFENCIQLLAGDNKDSLIQKILESETALLYELDSLIEDIKHHWKEDSANINIEPFKSIDSISVELVLDRIRAMRGVGDRTGSIKKMVGIITQNIIERLPDLKIDQIVISGRAFRFKMLKDILEKELKRKFKHVECHYNDGSAKSGCLIGASNGIRLCQSSSIVGLPLIIDASKVVENPKAFIEHLGSSISEDDNHPVPIKKKALDVEGFYQKFLNSINVIKDLIGNDDSAYTSNSINVNNKVEDAKLLMTEGKEYKKINSNSLISISGRYYVPADRYHISDKDKPFSIYFDGESFYLRHKHGSHQLIASNIQGTQNLCFESQFPYSIKDGINKK